jgi:hypothetical protein
VLAGAGFGDDAGFTHALGQQSLTDGVIHLVRAGMIQVFPLQINLRAAQVLAPTLGMVKRRRPADVIS